MSVKISPEMFSNAVVITPTNNEKTLKNIINLELLNSGSIKKDSQAVGLLNLGNKGDNCVSLITIKVSDEFKPNYYLFWLVELSSSIYIQKGYFNDTTNLFEVWVDDTLSFNITNNSMLLALIEKDLIDNNINNGGNILEQKEIFVSDEFMGYVEDNFLNKGWNASLTTDEDLYVIDSLGEENPTEFRNMIWVNGETKLNAANMNNIMLGIQKANNDINVINNNINVINNNVSNINNNISDINNDISDINKSKEVNFTITTTDLDNSVYNVVQKQYSSSDVEDICDFILNQQGKINLKLTFTIIDEGKTHNFCFESILLPLLSLTIVSTPMQPEVNDFKGYAAFGAETSFYVFPIKDNPYNNIRFQLTAKSEVTGTKQVILDILTLPIESVDEKVESTINKAIEQEY